uniref:vexin-like n=1 Tax=Pristiophorus japonicus TaxID=55135 RepID=UPI00398EA310
MKYGNDGESPAKVLDNNQPVGLPLSEPGRYNKVRRSPMFEKSQALPVMQASLRPGVIPEPTTDVSSFTEGKQRKSEKNIRKDPILALESDASVPLTGNISHTTPSILRRIIMKNRKKAPCSGTTNNAFEPD